MGFVSLILLIINGIYFIVPTLNLYSQHLLPLKSPHTNVENIIHVDINGFMSGSIPFTANSIILAGCSLLNFSKMIYTNSDGGARGNPGPSAIGIIVRDGEKILEEHAEVLKKPVTNNIAEYTALIKALEIASKHTQGEITSILDSELVVKQLLGRYKVRNQNLLPLFLKVQKLQESFKTIKYKHVSRWDKYQKIADEITLRMRGGNYRVILERKEAIACALSASYAGDTVLIAGKGHENYQILKDRTIHFSDTEEAAAAIKGRQRA